MTKDKLLLLSLDEDESQEVAQAVTNKTSRKILSFLAEKDSATLSVISKELNLAISTVQYHIDGLQKAGIVEWDKYHYSSKGKEVKHYKLVNQFIVIAPKKKKEGLMEALKGIFPAFILSIGVTALIYFKDIFYTVKEESSTMMYESAADSRMMALAVEETPKAANYSQFDLISFFIGTLFALLIVVVTIIIRLRK